MSFKVFLEQSDFLLLYRLASGRGIWRHYQKNLKREGGQEIGYAGTQKIQELWMPVHCVNELVLQFCASSRAHMWKCDVNHIQSLRLPHFANLDAISIHCHWYDRSTRCAALDDQRIRSILLRCVSNPTLPNTK